MVRRNNQLPTNLLQLQNCIKRDADSYKEEFQLQHTHFKALLDVVKLNPSSPDKQFEELSMFMAQVSPWYKEELKTLPNDLMEVLRTYSTLLHPEVRLTLVKALILMRNRRLLTETDLLSLFFQLLRCQDKELRKFLKNHLITDIKNMNAKQKDIRVNTKLQNFMYSMISEGSGKAGKMSLDIMSELYKKHVWRDVKTVNVIGEACFSKVTKVMVTALRFFLGKDEEEEKDSSSSEEEEKVESLARTKKARKDQRLSNCVNSKSRKRQKLMRRIEKKMKKKEKKSSILHSDFSALHLIYDPQGMAEKLLKMMECMNERFEIKIMLMNLISRLIAVHDLFLFNFYPFLQRYLRPHQSEVTKILLFVAQSTHEKIPPEIVEPLMRTITENFISERNSTECITVGINSIREISSRCPLVMNEHLLQDLAMYQKYKDKNVSMAARSLVQLFRVTNPGLLRRKDRGRPTEATADLEPKSYGELRAPSYVPGAEVLAEKSLKGEEEEEEEWEDDEEEEWEDDDDEEEEEREDDNDEGDGWESCSDEGSNGDDDDDDDEWSEVSSDDKDEVSEEKEVKDEGEEKRKAKTRTEEREELRKVRSEEASLISSTRILTDEEFKVIKKAQLKKQYEALHPRNQRESKSNEKNQKESKSNEKNQRESKSNENKRRIDSDEGSDSESEEEMTDLMEKKELVSLRDIERLYKKPRENKESRLATVVAGREGREKFGKRKEKMNPHSSTKEKEKKKNKAFSMIKHKVRGKKKKSFQDKQRELKSRLIKKLKHSHK